MSLAGVVGQRYGTIFQMVPDPANRKLFQLQVAEQIVDFEGLFLTGRANRGNIMYRKQIFNAACVYVATYFLSSVLLPAGFLKIQQPEFFILVSF